MLRFLTGPPPGASAGRTTASLFLLSLASSLSPFGMIVVVPTLAAVATRYSVGHGQAQFLIAAYLFGLGVGQPVCGALADRFGRRPVILTGFVLFTFASIACTFAPTFGALVLMRFLQAVGVSVGTVGSRAIVRDTHDAIGAAQSLAWIGAAMGIAPVIGPAVGGWLGAVAGPSAVFGASATLGAIVTAALFVRLPETLNRDSTDVPRQPWRTSYRQLLGSRVFMGYTLMYALIQGCFFAFLAVGAVVFEEHLGLDQERFGMIWGAMALVYVLAAAAGAKLNALIGLRNSLLAATWAAVLAGWLLAICTIAAGITLAGLLVPLALLLAAAGIQTPLSIAGAVNCRPDISGTAAGLSSSLALVASGAFSIVSGFTYAGSFTPIAILIALTATMTGVTYRMTRPV